MRLSALLLVVVVSGCGTVKYEAPPAGVPTAMLRFTTNTPNMVALVGIDTRACPKEATGYLIAGSEKDTGDGYMEPVTLGMIGSTGRPEPRTQERLIEAGRPLYFKAWTFHLTGRYNHQCEIPAVFSPQPGHQYEMQFLIEESGCRLNLGELSLGPGGKVQMTPEPFRTLKIRRAVKNFCDAE